MSTKNTILKQYDGRFLQIFQEIYEQVQPESGLRWLRFTADGAFGCQITPSEVQENTHRYAFVLLNAEV